MARMARHGKGLGVVKRSDTPVPSGDDLERAARALIRTAAKVLSKAGTLKMSAEWLIDNVRSKPQTRRRFDVTNADAAPGRQK
jgi:hypothetical protein